MKWYQFFFILAGIYLSPRVSNEVALIIATIFTFMGLAAAWRKK